MKNYTKLLMFSGALLFSVNLSAQEKIISKDQLPTSINTFLSTHFSKFAVSQVTEEKKLAKMEYEILLENGTKLEFNNSVLAEIESREQLPNAIVPKAIRDYVQKNYPKSYVKEWKMKIAKQTVELSNGMELEFTKDGKFLRIDD